MGKDVLRKGKGETLPNVDRVEDDILATFSAETDTVVIPGTVHLESATTVRTEMARVYKALRAGQIPIHAGTRMIFALVQLHKAKIEVDKLRVAGRLADQMQAFGGLQIIGPNVPAKAREFMEEVTGPAKKGP